MIITSPLGETSFGTGAATLNTHLPLVVPTNTFETSVTPDFTTDSTDGTLPALPSGVSKGTRVLSFS